MTDDILHDAQAFISVFGIDCGSKCANVLAEDIQVFKSSSFKILSVSLSDPVNAFMRKKGAEVLLENAQFIASFNPAGVIEIHFDSRDVHVGHTSL